MTSRFPFAIGLLAAPSAFAAEKNRHAGGSTYDLRRLPTHGEGEPAGRAGRDQRRRVRHGEDRRRDLRR
jgi:hypothetical protein